MTGSRLPAPSSPARGASLRELGRLAPHCAVLFGRLARDDRVARRHKLVLIGAAAYLAMPLDLVPDFIPVLGYADDAIVVAIALRRVVRTAGEEAVLRNWRGSEAGLSIVRRLAGLA
jgi:uncharacterized membrane protein YkvA (DUF1232 family)